MHLMGEKVRCRPLSGMLPCTFASLLPLPPRWSTSVRGGGRARVDDAAFALQKGATCRSSPEMKAPDLSAHLLSACSRSPLSVGAVANEPANGLSPRRHYGVFI